MTATTAVILTAMLSTPIVHVTPHSIVEAPRAHVVMVAETPDSQTETGIDDTAVSDFVSSAAKRYKGF